MQSKGHISGVPTADAYDLRAVASIHVKHKLAKPVSVIYYPIFVVRGNEYGDWGVNFPMNALWSQFGSVFDNGTATRSVSLSYQGAVASYTYAVVNNNNSEQSWIKLDGTEILHQYNWGVQVKKMYNRYPASVDLGAVKTWSHINPAITITVVADSITRSGWTENPSLGQRRNPPPDLFVVQPNVWTP